ncbi:MAG: gliding motility-associated C-terminal domain-containing protein [Bacteroidia bacterium]|nr:gliding motility-associated C-terminal domain-containing protein [Bacteroidia bacterium]MCZ2278137.1 gliding motility-associated C-terminal domain-containing protein [Bacteroidia bacterium]
MKKYLFAVYLCLLITSYLQAQNCIGSSTISITPPPNPLTGCYEAGSTITVCVSITNYSQGGINWLHGIVPLLGSGWDSTTLAAVSASPSCDGMGVWGWFTSCTSTNTGLSFGPGFYYDTPSGSSTGIIDGIPGNNYGDNCISFTWNFCFSVATISGISAQLSGNIGVTVYGDQVSGSWTVVGCTPETILLPYCIQENCTVQLPTLITTNPACHGDSTGTAYAAGASGQPPYTYLWSTGDTTQTLTNLGAGIYSVTVFDVYNCSKIVFFQITEPDEILDNATVLGPGCVPNSGSITTAVTGGTQPYTFLWNDGSITSSLSSLTTGAYTLTVTDSAGCSAVFNYTLTGYTPMSLSVNSSNAQCDDLVTGSASVNVTGGNPPFAYQWSNGNTDSLNMNISPGIYTVTVTDASGCTETQTVTVGQNPQIFVTLSGNSNLCEGDSTTLTANASGGSGGSQFLWSNGSNNSYITVLPPTGTSSYTVTVTDNTGCSASSVLAVNVGPIPAISISDDVTICHGESTPLSVSGATTYQWVPVTGLSNPNVPNPVASPSVTTSYIVTATEGGCSVTDSVTVTVSPEVTAAATPDVSSGTAPLTVNFTNQSNGATTYSWNFGDNSTSGSANPQHVFTSNGTYDVTLIATNTDGCSDTLIIRITVENGSSFSVPNVFTPNHDGFNDLFMFNEDGITEVKAEIYNRWGEKIISWDKPGFGWDGTASNGKEAPDGTYFVVVNATGQDGTKYELAKSFQLIRSAK